MTENPQSGAGAPNTAASSASRRLKDRLRAELRWLRLRLVARALLLLIGGAGLVLGAVVLSRSGWTQLGPIGAWLIWGVLAFIFLWVLLVELLYPLRAVANLKGFTRSLENHGPFSNLLEAATQFSSRRREDPLKQGASPRLVEEILRRAGDAAEQSRLAPRVPMEGAGRQLVLALLALALWGGILGLAPDRIRPALDDLAHPSRLDLSPPTEGIWAVLGDLDLAVDSSVDLLVRDFSGERGSVVLEINRGGDFWQQLATGERRATVGYVEYGTRMEALEDPFTYRFRKGERLSRIHRVDLRERPVLRSLAATIIPPAYSGQEAREEQELAGSLVLLEGTRVELRGEASRDLAAAWRLEVDQERHALQVEGGAFVDTLEVDRDRHFRILLEDTDGLRGRALTVYQFNVDPDDPPTVELLRPTEDVVLDRSLSVNLSVVAADDVGLDRMELLYRLSSADEWSRTPLYPVAADSTRGLRNLRAAGGELEQQIEFDWDLGEQSLLPGDALQYCIEAVDNNALEGGQVSRTAVYRLRLPTFGEILSEQSTDRLDAGEKLSETLEEGKKLQEDLDRLARELKKEPDPDFARREEIKEALERQQSLREDLESRTSEMREQAQKFRRDNAGSPELLEKMEAIRKLLEELEGEDLLAALKALEEGMEEMLPHEIRRSLEEAQTSQEEMNRRLDRSLALMEQLEQERQMSDLLEETAESLQRQRELLEEAEAKRQEDAAAQENQESQEGEDSESGDSSENQEGETPEGEEMSAEEAARQQEQLKQQAEELEKRLEEALEEMREQQSDSEQPTPSQKQMQEALEEAKRQMEQQGKPSESMSEAQEKLQEGQEQEALEKQQEAMRRLLALYEVLAEGMEGMQMAQGKDAIEKLQQTSFDLLQLSFLEETLIDPLRENARGQNLQPLIREQGRIARSAGRINDDLVALSKQDVEIPEPLLAEFRDLVEMLEDATTQLQVGRARRSLQAVENSMGQMNQTVMNLLTTAQQKSQSSSSGEQPSATEMLKQMGQEQRRLNGQSEELRRQAGRNGMGESEQQMLSELKARQQLLREQMGELKGRVEDERRLLGDLDEMGEDMERITEALGEGRLDADLREQQEMILSKLLEAQRSVRQQEMRPEREGQAADELWSAQEGEEGGADAESEERLRRWQAPEQAPPAYRDAVRRYFRKVQEELNKGGKQ